MKDLQEAEGSLARAWARERAAWSEVPPPPLGRPGSAAGFSAAGTGRGRVGAALRRLGAWALGAAAAVFALGLFQAPRSPLAAPERWERAAQLIEQEAPAWAASWWRAAQAAQGGL